MMLGLFHTPSILRLQGGGSTRAIPRVAMAVASAKVAVVSLNKWTLI